MARVYRGGPGYSARPENALKRSDELEAIGQKSAALQVLHDVICSKKHRTWSKTFEAIMLRHVELCVDMKKRNYAKEALLQYRNMCHQVNINSLEEVIKHFLKRAADKAEEAQAKAAVSQAPAGLRSAFIGSTARGGGCDRVQPGVPAQDRVQRSRQSGRAGTEPTACLGMLNCGLFMEHTWFLLGMAI